MTTEEDIREEERQRHFDPRLWKRVLVHARPYRRQMVGLGVSGLLVAGIDVLLPRVTGLTIDTAVSEGVGFGLLRHALEYLGLVALMSALIGWFIVLAGQLATGFAYDLRETAFRKLQELSFSFYDRRPVGWLMARLTSDCERISSILPWFTLDLVWGVALIVGVSVSMFLLNADLALYVVLILPPLAVVSVIFQNKMLKSQREVRKTNSLITAGFNEAIMGVRTSKALVREEENLRDFQGLSTSMFGHSVRNALQAAVYLPIIITLGSVGVGFALWQGGVRLGEGMTYGMMVTFMQYAAFFYMPIQELAERFTQMQAAQASAERLQGLLDTEPEIRDAPEVVERAAKGMESIDEPVLEIAFENVSFQYRGGEKVLDRFDLRVVSGQTIALVGATGSGKTTIVSLLSRFYEPTSGAIKINGIDYRQRSLRWLQSKLGIVLQAPHLFAGSIRENIRYGRLDATDEEITAAAEQVNADEFIRAFPEGYDTDVGEGGNRLSTGQKQLLALARAVLADPEIFILDEATSSVDTETERLIQDGIERMLAGRISFIIAHRLSTIRTADRILVIEQGRIVEEGMHEELIRARGKYYGLYTNQFTRESQERALRAATGT